MSANFYQLIFIFFISIGTSLSSARAQVAITESVVNASCFGAKNGAIDITVIPSDSYFFSWSGSFNYNSSQEDITNLLAGVYTVTVTRASDNAEFTKNISVRDGGTTDLAISVSMLQDVECHGESTGQMIFDITGGQAPYSLDIQQDDERQNAVLSDFQSFRFDVSEITSLISANYDVAVKDAVGCVRIMEDVFVNQRDSISVLFDYTYSACDGSPTGSIDINQIVGGVAPYTVAWYAASSGNSVISTDQDVVNLQPDFYTLVVTDAAGCVKALPPLEIIQGYNIVPIVEAITCQGENNGKIELNIFTDTRGTQLPIQITWKDGRGNTIANNTNTLENVAPGQYKVELIDKFGCERETELITIDSPTPISVERVSISRIVCMEDLGAINIFNPSGGTGSSYTVFASDGVDEYSANFFSDSASISDLPTGTYTVKVQDINGCELNAGDYVINSYTGPDLTIQNQSVMDNFCFDDENGEISISLTSLQDITIDWFYEDETTSFSNSTFINNLKNGDYKVVISAPNDCVNEVVFSVHSPANLDFRSNIEANECDGDSKGKISIDPIGGSGVVAAIDWYMGTSTSNTLLITPFNATQIENLVNGNYFVRVEKGGCEYIKTFIVSTNDFEVKETIKSISCIGSQDGSILLEISGGKPNYSFVWTDYNANVISNDSYIENLSEGSYSVEVTDARSCTQQYSNTFYVNGQYSTFRLQADVGDITCSGRTDGNIDLIIDQDIGHPLDYAYRWYRDGAFLTSGTEDLGFSGIGLPEGEYTVEVTDANGCVKTETYTVAEPDPISFVGEVENQSCFGVPNGSIRLTVVGGLGSFNFEWSKDGNILPDNSPFLFSIEKGRYDVVITDAGECSRSATYIVEEPAPIIISTIAVVEPSCYGRSDGTLSVNIVGGLAPYSITWFKNGGLFSTNDAIENLDAAQYIVRVADAMGCYAKNDTINLQDPPRLRIEVLQHKSPTCTDETNGALSFRGAGGVGDYTYSVNGNDFSSNSNYYDLPVGEYQLSVLDGSTCQFDTSIVLNQQIPLEAMFRAEAEYFIVDNPIKFLDESLGDSIISWFWDFGDNRASTEQNPTLFFYNTGTYKVNLRVRNSSGCVSNRLDSIIINKGYKLTVPNAFTPNGDGVNDFFRPVFKQIDEMDITITNRHGQTIYHSNLLDQFWDGTYNGRLVVEGAYYYIINFVTSSGVAKNTRGKVFLYR